MQRINGHKFYDLATKVHPLTQIGPKDTIKSRFWQLWEARAALIQIFQDVPLRVCNAPSQKLIGGIDGVLPRDIQAAAAALKDESEIGYYSYTISEGANEFETVLAAELQGLDTYLVSQKGTHSTPDLIERAEIMFPELIRRRLSDRAKNDIRQAGRCLALDNFTASAFHIMRAIESVMAMYFQAVTGKPLPTRMRNWSIYLKALQKHPDHSPRVVSFLDHIRDSYRNPILHPEIVVTEDEAESLLGVAASAIRMLVLETEAVENKTQPLPFGPTPPIALPPAVGL